MAAAVDERSFVVPAGAARERLDRFLAARLPGLSRARIGALIRGGAATVAARTALRPARRLAPGAEVRLCVPPPPDPDAAPRAQPIALRVAFEDEALIAIDKPAGMTVHPAPGSPDGTLVNALLAHCGGALSAVGGALRPGIVHRLDKDTSGLMVAAKTDAAHRALAAQFARREIDRAYLAAVAGVPAPASGVIDAPIGRDPRNRKRMAATARGRPARTRYAVETAYGARAALVRCVLETGRTHQIRVHLAHRGWPALGDPLYGGRGALARALPRQALHACRLGFTHPVSGARLVFESALPGDIAGLIGILENARELPGFGQGSS